jgi:ADP-ribose pyrophosphatase YjhB (NUDIX family)
MADKTVIVSVAVVFRKRGKKTYWFVVRPVEENSLWELPRTMVRRGESSVRASIRAMAEQGGMRAKALEEVGRSGGAVKLKGKPVVQRSLYYLMAWKDGGEVIGYAEHQWLEYGKAVRRVPAKRDKMMLKQARDMLVKIDKERGDELRRNEYLAPESGE